MEMFTPDRLAALALHRRHAIDHHVLMRRATHARQHGGDIMSQAFQDLLGRLVSHLGHPLFSTGEWVTKSRERFKRGQARIIMDAN